MRKTDDPRVHPTTQGYFTNKSTEEAKALRAFAKFKEIKSQPMNAGYDTPIDQQSLPDLELMIMGDEIDTMDFAKPFGEWDIEDQYDAYPLALIGQKAQIHSSDARSRFSEMIVTLDH